MEASPLAYAQSIENYYTYYNMRTIHNIMLKTWNYSQ